MQERAGPFDRGTEPADDSLLKALDHVPGLRARFERVRLGTPIIGSLEYRDRLVRFGDHPGTGASGKLSVALDHLTTWYRLIYEAQVIPVSAHFTLLRPALEGAVQARWLLDPNVDAATRVRRGLGFVLDDFDEQHKLEVEMVADGWAPSDSYVGAADRRHDLHDAASAASLEPIQVLDTTALMRKYEVLGGRTDVVAFRVTSGVLHAKAWATLMSEIKRTEVGETTSTFVAAGSQPMAAGFTAAAIGHVDAAVRDFEGYVQPTIESRPCGRDSDLLSVPKGELRAGE